MSLRLLTAGDSHGPELVAVLDGMPAGIPLTGDDIDKDLLRRQGGHGRGARSTRVERDRVELVAGVAGGLTTGAPLGLRIPNLDFLNQPATRPPITAPRPGHADLAGSVKFGIFDLRMIRERASARETAARVAAGAAAKALLRALGVTVGSFVTGVGAIQALPDLAHLTPEELTEFAARAEEDPVRCWDQEASGRMVEAVDRARVERQTLGGTFVIHALGLPVGLGSYTQADLRLDSRLGAALLSIPAVKGVELGPAFDVCQRDGAAVQDAIVVAGSGLSRPTNFAGGLEGGMTNGMPLVARCAMKPLSSVRTPLESIDLESGAAVAPPYVRSDICAVPAAAVVGEAVAALVLASAALERFGGDRLDLIRASLAIPE